MRPPRDTPKQHSNFLHKPAHLLCFLYHFPRCPNQAPGIIRNSSSSPNLHRQSLTKSHGFQVPPRSITSADVLPGTCAPCSLHTTLTPWASSRHTPSDTTAHAQGLLPVSLCVLLVSLARQSLRDEQEF